MRGMMTTARLQYMSDEMSGLMTTARTTRTCLSSRGLVRCFNVNTIRDKPDTRQTRQNKP